MDLALLERFQKSMLYYLGFPPTEGQKMLLRKLSAFALSNSRGQVFLLKGYAGTGKTTIVSTLVKSLPVLRQQSVLLAPTGRAAKVLAGYSNQRAYTIHKYIYYTESSPDGQFSLSTAPNKHKNTTFIVDEASMIPDRSAGPNGSVMTARNILDDLMEFVFSGENCKLLLLGDQAQLPPVGLDISPALDLENLKSRYPFHFHYHELTEVVRQAEESGILFHATEIRNRLAAKDFHVPLFHRDQYKDFVDVPGMDLQDALEDAYSNGNVENCIIVTRSNKRANQFNQEIRNRILFREGEINGGDYLMVVKNNYFWLPKESKAGFIANGDIIEILRVTKITEMYGFRFADISMRMIDYPEEKEMEVRIILNTLDSETPSLPRAEAEKLWYSIMEDYSEVKGNKKKAELVKNNPWFNALQVKFAYALTCHKTQGGQWDHVFVDQGYITEKHIDQEWFRWLYTAITRGVKKTYMVNFRDIFWD